MDSGAFNTDVLRDIQQWLAKERTRHQECIARITAIEQTLAEASGNGNPEPRRTPDSHPGKIGLANGRRLSDDEFQNLGEDNFDLILDMTTHTLRCRWDPAKHTPLLPLPLSGLGSERLRVLIFMLEHPTRPICSDTIPLLLGEHDEILEPGALAQTIMRLRKALGTSGRQNPYILTEPAWGESQRRGACVYVLNSRWDYLLIRWDSEITEKSKPR